MELSEGMNTVLASAAARATVLGEKDSQSNPLAKAGVPDASTDDLHREGGEAEAVYFGSPDTDIVLAVTTVFTVSFICIVDSHRDNNAAVHISGVKG